MMGVPLVLCWREQMSGAKWHLALPGLPPGLNITPPSWREGPLFMEAYAP